jgi:hypothetical protein
MPGQLRTQGGVESRSLPLRGVYQAALAQYPQHGQPGRGADRVVGVGEAVGEPAGGDRVVHGAGAGREPERPVTGGRTLGADHDVRPYVPVLAGEPSAGPPEPGHHLVGDQ